MATAAASRVAVIAQAAFDGEASRYLGSSGTIGMTRVCISETTIPAKASTPTTAFDLGGADDPPFAWRARGWDMEASVDDGGVRLLDLGKQISLA
ncbi:hypothetical protein GCM10010303_30130 [Streptomyces purpurascens]|nr:hypothetical protein GCM10010303_30130 [Streptomyces purpurascens]